MTLLELCEPLFQYVCQLSRSARMGYTREKVKVHNEVKEIFARMRADATTSAGLSDLYEQVELPLIFFVDFMIKESKLNFDGDWSELACERGELAGDEKFFDLLDEQLDNPSKDLTEILSVFYTCIGLGFTGFYKGQPETIQRLMSKIASRISGMIDADKKSQICPQAYENVDARDFIEPAGTKLAGIGITLIGLVIVWVIAYFYLFAKASKQVDNSLETIIDYNATKSIVDEDDLPDNGAT